MPHFKAIVIINLHYEVKFVKKILIKPQMTNTSQDNNLNYIHFLKHFYEYLTKKLKYRDLTFLILKILP